MRTILAALGLLALGAWTMADFPPVNDLPARPELPDPLVCLDGKKIDTKQDWLAKRKPELKQLFQHYMYGTFPEKPADLAFKVERIDPMALGGKATLKEVTISFGPPETPRIHLLVVVPNKRTGPVPVIFGLNFTGNHSVLADPKIALPKTWVASNKVGVKNNRATDEGRGTAIGTWSIEQTIDAGYAVATAYYGDIDPDRADLREGIQPHLAKPGTTPGPSDWGTIAAWAWGMSRCIDYLVTDSAIDASQIVAFGHSRLGKTTLLCAAFDERVAVAIPHQSGCGGAGPSRARSTKAESVEKITKQFPHWFDGHFKEFGTQVDKLPFDQNCLIALVAPRPVLLSNAMEDQWANPDGQFAMLKSADSVYKLFGSVGLAVQARPAVGTLVDSPLGYFIRDGKHSTTPEDWRIFVRYADAQLKKR
jgi:hypothetical protein